MEENKDKIIVFKLKDDYEKGIIDIDQLDEDEMDMLIKLYNYETELIKKDTKEKRELIESILYNDEII